MVSDTLSSTSVTVSTKAIEEIVEKLHCQYLRQPTKSNYYGVWKTFNQFNIKLDSRPKSWEERLTLFVGYLIGLNRQSSTIKSYISAIKSVLKYEKIELKEDKLLLYALIKACKCHNDYFQTKLPIRKGLLQIIIRSVDTLYEEQPQPYLCAMYKALFAVMYYGLCRIGEVTASPHVVKAKDVYIGLNKHKLMLVLHSSKTHNQNAKPQIIKIDSVYKPTLTAHQRAHSGYNQYCPFWLVQQYINMCKKYQCDDEQFFVMQDRSLVTPAHFRAMLRKILRHNKIDSTLYSSKAFRAG